MCIRDSTWTLLNGAIGHVMRTFRFAQSIYVSTHNRNTVFVTFGGYVSGNVFRTDDNGANWTRLGQNLPETPIRTLTGHPTRSNWIYIGTEVGVFGSEDNGASWSPVNEGPANVSVEDLFWNGQELICVTHGRGVFSVVIP